VLAQSSAMTTCPKNPITQSLRSQIDARNIKSRPHQQVPKILLYSELLSTSSIDLTLMMALSLLMGFRTFPRSSFSRTQQKTHQVSVRQTERFMASVYSIATLTPQQRIVQIPLPLVTQQRIAPHTKIMIARFPSYCESFYTLEN
jgi:hypothetical protein